MRAHKLEFVWIEKVDEALATALSPCRDRGCEVAPRARERSGAAAVRVVLPRPPRAERRLVALERGIVQIEHAGVAAAAAAVRAPRPCGGDGGGSCRALGPVGVRGAQRSTTVMEARSS